MLNTCFIIEDYLSNVAKHITSLAKIKTGDSVDVILERFAVKTLLLSNVAEAGARVEFDLLHYRLHHRSECGLVVLRHAPNVVCPN